MLKVKAEDLYSPANDLKYVADELRSNIGGLVIATDYDGTLSPIVSNPLLAGPEPEALETLEALNENDGSVTIITGRDISTLDILTEGRLTSIPGIIISGQYGLEEYANGKLIQIATPFDDGMIRARQELQTLIEQVVKDDGVTIEDKTRSHVLHFRNAQDPNLIAGLMTGPMNEIARAYGLQIKAGKMVLEVRIPGYDKGMVLEQLITRIGRTGVVFAGDDHGDAPAMHKVHQLREARIQQIGYAVASTTPDTAVEVTAAADLRVRGTRGMVRFLQRVARIS